MSFDFVLMYDLLWTMLDPGIEYGPWAMGKNKLAPAALPCLHLFIPHTTSAAFTG